MVEDGRWLGELQDELRARLAPVFCQARSRLAAFAYVGALLAAPGERRSCWQLAEQAGQATPRRMQALLAEHAWDWGKRWPGCSGSSLTTWPIRRRSWSWMRLRNSSRDR